MRTDEMADELRQPAPRRLSFEGRLMRSVTLREAMAFYGIGLIMELAFAFIAFTEYRDRPLGFLACMAFPLLLVSPLGISLFRSRARVRRLCRHGAFHMGAVAGGADKRAVGMVVLRVRTEGAPDMIAEIIMGLAGPEIRIGDPVPVLLPERAGRHGLVMAAGQAALGKFV